MNDWLDDFLVRAHLGGIGVAVAAGPLGCFVVWRRMAYFGDAVAHSALLGVAMGILLEIDMIAGIVITCLAFALLIGLLQEQRTLAADTLLGILSHSALALGLIALTLLPPIRVDLMGYLFGDILAVSRGDLLGVYGVTAGVLTALWWLWRPLLAVTVSEDLARASGIQARSVRFGFTVMLALVIALAMKVIGILLITALLIIPAAAARRLASTPEQMAGLAAMAGTVAVIVGIQASLRWDTPTGPSIVVAALGLFIVVQTVGAMGAIASRWRPAPSPSQRGNIKERRQRGEGQ